MPGTNSILIPFDCIVNIDFGIMKLLQRDYNNPKYIFEPIMKADDNLIRYYTVTNDDENIIKMCLNDDNKDKADEIRYSLLEQHYDEILELSDLTGIYTLVKQFMNMASGDIQFTIICKNEQEQRYIQKLNNKIGTDISALQNVDLSIYDNIYLRNIEQSVIMNPKGKNIFIMAYKFNFEDEFKTLKSPVLALVGDVNVFYTIDVYSELKKPEG